MVSFTLLIFAFGAGYLLGGAYVGNHYDPYFYDPPKGFSWLNGYYRKVRRE